MYTFIDAMGEEQVMSREEAQLIEASGRSCFEKYSRMTFQPFSAPFAKALIAAMHERVDKVPEGKHPVQQRQVPRLTRGNPESYKKADRWHLRGQKSPNPLCGKKVNTADVFGFKKFTRLANLKKCCNKCHAAWAAEMREGTHRAKNSKSML